MPFYIGCRHFPVYWQFWRHSYSAYFSGLPWCSMLVYSVAIKFNHKFTVGISKQISIDNLALHFLWHLLYWRQIFPLSSMEWISNLVSCYPSMRGTELIHSTYLACPKSFSLRLKCIWTIRVRLTFNVITHLWLTWCSLEKGMEKMISTTSTFLRYLYCTRSS